jgi:hypothetical protein
MLNVIPFWKKNILDYELGSDHCTEVKIINRMMPAGGKLKTSKIWQESISQLDLTHQQMQTQSVTHPKSTPVPISSNYAFVASPQSSQEPSMLATLIWRGYWPSVERRLITHPEEARQEIQLPAFPNSDISIKAFPIHLACARRPLPSTRVMKDLLSAHPEACKQATGSPLGLLPIHLVADLSNIRYNGDRVEQEKEVHTSLPAKVSQSPNHAEIVMLLLRNFPESVLLPETINEMLPLHIAAATFKADNCINRNPSAVPVNVLELLVDAGPPQVATKLRDRHGLSPMDWASRNALYACPTCSKEFNHDATLFNMQQAIYSKLGTGIQCCSR